jgi:hypothetical protein
MEGWAGKEPASQIGKDARMTTLLQTDPRRAARDASRKPLRPLEMPVLFQLADLSHFQVKVTPPSSNPSVPERQVISSPAESPDPVVQGAPPEREISRVEQATAEIPSVEVAPVEPLPEPAAHTLAVEEIVTPPTMTPVMPVEDPVIEKTAETTIEVATAVAISATEATPPQEPNSPTPRERAEQRAKSRQPVSSNNDWMRTHGKYIAVGFIVALIATIYLAQSGDEPPPANPNSTVSANAEPKVPEPLPVSEAEAKITDAHTARESIPAPGGGRSPALVKEANLANEQSPAEAHAELHSPALNNTVKEPSEPVDVAESKTLFPWKDSGENRVASKPGESRSNMQLNPHVTNRQSPSPAVVPENESQGVAPSVYGPPGNQPQEPSAEEPAAAEQNAPSNYPATNPSSFGEYQPSQNRPATTPPRASSPRATPASYEPATSNNVPPTRTSGPRNERTGSGLY